jgi:hypothetical protein
VGLSVEGQHHRVANPKLRVTDHAILIGHPPNLIGTERGLGEFDDSVGVSGDHPRADGVVSLWDSWSLSTIHDDLDAIQLPKLTISLNDTRQLAVENP